MDEMLLFGKINQSIAGHEHRVLVLGKWHFHFDILHL